MSARHSLDDRKSQTASVCSARIVAATESLERAIDKGRLEAAPFVEDMYLDGPLARRRP